MKKLSSFFSLFLFLAGLIFAESYKIDGTSFNIKGAGFKFLGKTREYAILTAYPVDTKTVFQDENLLNDYLADYKTKLESSRAFESVEIGYETVLSQDQENPYTSIILKFDIQDSHHLLALPYGKYSSNSGLSLKLKAKDTNFLGSLNTMSTDLNLKFSDEGIAPGLTFSYDHPFKLFAFDAVWVNEHSVSYTIGDTSPEWDLKTGLKFTLPFEKLSLVFEFYQYAFRNFDYASYGDDTYFKEAFAFSLPINLYKFKNYTYLVYSPGISYNFNWDFDGININNEYFTTHVLTASHSLSNENIVWADFFRSGYSFTLANSFIYNIQRNDISPYLAFEGKLFLNYQLHDQDYWDRYGITMDLYAFTYIDLPSNSYNYGNEIGDRLRGILDKNFFGNEYPEYTASSAIVLNLDLPHKVFTTNFKKDLINFNFQFAPFFDMALVYNRKTNNLFSFKEGYYCTGLEILVFPLKWSSYTVRASFGLDLASALKRNNLLEALSYDKEIYIGIGLQY